MSFVENDPFHILKAVCVIVDLVLEDLGGHDNYCGVSVDAHISCEDTNIVSKFNLEVPELLI